MYSGSCWPNGSYFPFSTLDNNYISCIHNETLDGNDDGGWLLPSGDPCTATTSPILCKKGQGKVCFVV